jgi:hypothetical protein
MHTQYDACLQWECLASCRESSISLGTWCSAKDECTAPVANSVDPGGVGCPRCHSAKQTWVGYAKECRCPCHRSRGPPGGLHGGQEPVGQVPRTAKQTHRQPATPESPAAAYFCASPAAPAAAPGAAEGAAGAALLVRGPSPAAAAAASAAFGSGMRCCMHVWQHCKAQHLDWAHGLTI